jgi:signal transduction histidine kinase/ActR/RegA family two-component response regulator
VGGIGSPPATEFFTSKIIYILPFNPLIFNFIPAKIWFWGSFLAGGYNITLLFSLYYGIVIMKRILQILNNIVNIGLSDVLSIEDAQKVRLTNILTLLPMPLAAYYFFFGLYQGLTFLWGICAFLLLGIFFVVFANHKKRYAAAKSISFYVYGLGVFMIHNSTNLGYCVTNFFFMLFISHEIMYDVKKQFKTFLPTIIFTFIAAIACFLAPRYIFFQSVFEHNVLHILQMSIYSFTLLMGGVYMGIVIKMHTLTEKKLTQAYQGFEKANKAKSDFLSNMSHELRTPLNGIIGTTNLLMHERASESQKKYYDVLMHTSDHMLHLINHILDFSKINESKINLDRNIFNLKHTLIKICRVCVAQDTKEGVSFNFEIAPELDKEIISDDLRLKQILFNLLSNAFKFTKNGTVSFKAVLLTANTEKITIRFSVQDTGIGIKPEQFEKIFESFEQADNSTTRNFGGTGLGLSISKQLVGLFGGNLQIESEYQKGSTFWFDIDVELNKAIVPHETEPVSAKNLNGVRVLVAEDNKVNRMVLLTFLKKWNVQFTETENGLLALEEYRKNEYDLILMDLEMPEMDGYTAIKEIRKLDNATPVIAFTAALYDNMAADLKNKGFNDYLHKPFNPIDLYNKISKYATVAAPSLAG